MSIWNGKLYTYRDISTFVYNTDKNRSLVHRQLTLAIQKIREYYADYKEPKADSNTAVES